MPDTEYMQTNGNPAHTAIIRPATLEDIPAIIVLNREGILSWASEFQPAIKEWMDSVCTDSYFEEMILNPEKTLLVADVAENIVGTAYGYPLNGKFHTGGLYSSMKGKGIGTLLIIELTQQARKLGLKVLTSEVYENNHTALRFFRRQGWVQRSSEKYNGIIFHTKVLVLS